MLRPATFIQASVRHPRRAHRRGQRAARARSSPPPLVRRTADFEYAPSTRQRSSVGRPTPSEHRAGPGSSTNSVAPRAERASHGSSSPRFRPFGSQRTRPSRGTRPCGGQSQRRLHSEKPGLPHTVVGSRWRGEVSGWIRPWPVLPRGWLRKRRRAPVPSCVCDSIPYGRPSFSCVHESRGPSSCACCAAEMSVSIHRLPGSLRESWKPTSEPGCHGGPGGREYLIRVRRGPRSRIMPSSDTSVPASDSTVACAGAQPVDAIRWRVGGQAHPRRLFSHALGGRRGFFLTQSQKPCCLCRWPGATMRTHLGRRAAVHNPHTTPARGLSSGGVPRPTAPRGFVPCGQPQKKPTVASRSSTGFLSSFRIVNIGM